MIIHDPMILWSLVGVTSGVILGIAGAGGGMIAIPMMIYLGGYGIKDATGYALWCLTVGAALAWYIQRENTNYGLTLVLALSSIACAYLVVPLKILSPAWLITLMLNGACLFSLYTLWVYKSEEAAGNHPPMMTSAVGGAMAGILNTMTGLGGGVVMIPWLISVGRLKIQEATACSLMVIALTAPFSVWAQGRMDIALPDLLSLTGGVLVAAMLTRQLILRFSEGHVNILRKMVLTSAILTAMIGTLLQL